MIKKVYSDLLSRQQNYKQHAVVLSFHGAKKQFIGGYINYRLTVKLAPKQITFHWGTNNLLPSVDLETIAKKIVNITKNVKTDITKVIILGIIQGRDNFKLKNKQATKHLKKICKEDNIPFILHHGINTRFHLNNCGLHLNDKGSTH